jgi:hypothetical protein
MGLEVGVARSDLMTGGSRVQVLRLQREGVARLFFIPRSDVSRGADSGWRGHDARRAEAACGLSSQQGPRPAATFISLVTSVRLRKEPLDLQQLRYNQ